MDERTPLLGRGYRDEEDAAGGPQDIHRQFCLLVGMKPSDAKKDAKQPTPGQSTLYGRVLKKRTHQNWVYLFTSSMSNTLLLTQVILGAALTGLGASESSHILITIFGAMNTVIAGLVAYLKSRGQPMRARMFRDDLDRVIDEIENSEIMWLGIAKDIHGYDEIAIDDSVSVRSEVARLTRLYDKAVRGNTANDPDMYQGSTFESVSAALRGKPGQPALPAPPASAPPASAPAATPAPAPAAPAEDAEDASPATAPDKPKEDPPKIEAPKAEPPKAEPPKTDDNDKTKTTPAANGKDDAIAKDPPNGQPDGEQASSPEKPADETRNDSAHDASPKTDGDTTAGSSDDTNAAASVPLPKDRPAGDPDASPATRK